MTGKTVFHINPPPRDMKCEVCRKHVKYLKPFGGKGDPLVGDFSGALLVKTFRRMGPYTEYSKFANELYEKEGKVDEAKVIEKFGVSNLAQFWLDVQVSDTISASWECRNCIVLPNEEYFKKIGMIEKEEKKC